MVKDCTLCCKAVGPQRCNTRSIALAPLHPGAGLPGSNLRYLEPCQGAAPGGACAEAARRLEPAPVALLWPGSVTAKMQILANLSLSALCVLHVGVTAIAIAQSCVKGERQCLKPAEAFHSHVGPAHHAVFSPGMLRDSNVIQRAARKAPMCSRRDLKPELA